MGICASNPLHAEDREQAKIAAFVRLAVTSDLVKLQDMIKRQKMDPNAKDRFGMTAIHWASYVGALECVQELIKAGALPEAVDTNGRNALHHACRKDQHEVVRYLVTTANLDVNARSENLDTPLHKAVRSKSVKVTDTLLKLGADPNLRNDHARTPLEELEAEVSSAPTVDIDRSNLVMPARTLPHRASRSETRVADNVLLDFAGFTGQPNRRSSRTEIKNFVSNRSRRSSIGEGSTATEEESGQWASSPTARKSPPLSARHHHESRDKLQQAGKRVIVAIRAKSAFIDGEKILLIRLLLQQYTTS